MKVGDVVRVVHRILSDDPYEIGDVGVVTQVRSEHVYTVTFMHCGRASVMDIEIEAVTC